VGTRVAPDTVANIPGIPADSLQLMEAAGQLLVQRTGSKPDKALKPWLTVLSLVYFLEGFGHGWRGYQFNINGKCTHTR